ncbi:MAG: hypothetical protein P8R54_20795 [Myxococcota bacterium]|nr:hypothetical protein [Myxococcota bacterium]
MAINPEYILCDVCEASHAAPFDFLRTPEQDAEVVAIQARRREQSQRGWAGPQYFSHATRALLCAEHRAEARRLGLSAVPIAEGMTRLRGEG